MKRLAAACVLSVLVGACGNGDWRASRSDYCTRLATLPQDVQAMFSDVDELGKLGDSDALPRSCAAAMASIREATGLLHGLTVGEAALYGGAPDRTADRAPFTTSSSASSALIQLVADRVRFDVACQNGDRAAVRAWVGRATAARTALVARLIQQTDDCAAAR